MQIQFTTLFKMYLTLSDAIVRKSEDLNLHKWQSH